MMRMMVDDRAFVIGLSELFRQEMKCYEVSHLLPLAKIVCNSLDLPPADVPVEGYYTESVELEHFFRLIRALQQIENIEISHKPAKDALCRLNKVLTSPSMGRLVSKDKLLSRTTSPLGEALRILSNWSIEGLCQESGKLVRRDDSGLIAVAATAGDPVGLCAARESMSLMADVELAEVQVPEFEWGVSKSVTEVAKRFLSALAKTTEIILPEPVASSSNLYGQAARDAEILGRCVLIGEQFGNQYPYYHWYIDLQDGQPGVKDFWSSHIWTTDSLRNMPIHMRPPTGSKVEAPCFKNDRNGNGTESLSNFRVANKVKLSPKRWFNRFFRHS